jgi:hypothetical protein
MPEVTMNTWVVAVIATAIVLRAAVLVREMVVARAIASGTLYGTNRLFPLKFIPIRVAAAFMAGRSETVCEELIGRMFVMRPAKATRGSAQWSLWQRAHVPAYALCALKKRPKSQDVLLRAIMAGLRSAVAESIAIRRPSIQRTSADGDEVVLEFDEFWPIVECIEQMAVHVDEHNRHTFSAGVAQLAASGDITARVQLAWVVNELLERSAGERALGADVAGALGRESMARHAHAALRILAAYKRAKGEEAVANVIEKIDPLIEQKEEAFLKSCGELARGLQKENLDSSERDVLDRVATLFEKNDFSETAIASAAAAIGKICDVFLNAGTSRSGLEGITALAVVRLTLRGMCHDLQDRIREMSSDAPAHIAAFSLARAVCRWLMEGVGQGVSGFIVVESMESIRDHLPSAAAEAMNDFLKRGPTALDPGIAVCVAEGVEDELYSEKPTDTPEEQFCKSERRRQFLLDARFEPAWKGWTSPAQKRDLDVTRVTVEPAAPPEVGISPPPTIATSSTSAVSMDAAVGSSIGAGTLAQAEHDVHDPSPARVPEASSVSASGNEKLGATHNAQFTDKTDADVSASAKKARDQVLCSELHRTTSGGLPDIRRFWEISLPLFEGGQRQDMPSWMNLRLALRRARPRRFFRGIVVGQEAVKLPS